MTGRDFGIPVWHEDVVPVDVLAVHAGRAVPQVVEDVDVVEDAVVPVRPGEDHLGVAGTHVGLSLRRRRRHLFHVQPPPLGPLPGEVHAGGQVREAVAGLQRPESHHGPEDEECEEEERHQGFPAEASHGRCPWCCNATGPGGGGGLGGGSEEGLGLEPQRRLEAIDGVDVCQGSERGGAHGREEATAAALRTIACVHCDASTARARRPPRGAPRLIPRLLAPRTARLPSATTDACSRRRPLCAIRRRSRAERLLPVRTARMMARDPDPAKSPCSVRAFVVFSFLLLSLFCS